MAAPQNLKQGTGKASGAAQAGLQMQMRAGVRQGLKANLQGSRGSEVKLPLSSQASQSAWVMLPMSHFCQMGRVWPTQASADPCSPPCSSDPAKGNLSFCITAFQKERKLIFSQRKCLLLISVNMREIDTAPPPPFMPAAYLNSLCHIRGSSESGAGCWHDTQLGFTCCPSQDHQLPMITHR